MKTMAYHRLHQHKFTLVCYLGMGFQMESQSLIQTVFCVV
jgi:hypothetical protein